MNGDGQVEFPLVDRVEVIDSTGRVFVEYLEHLGVSVQMQDNGRTMKLFVSGPRDRENNDGAGEKDLANRRAAYEEANKEGRLGPRSAPRLSHNRGVA